MGIKQRRITMSEVSTEVEKESEKELKDFRFVKFSSYLSLIGALNHQWIELTDEEKQGEMVLGFLPKRETPETKERKNSSTMKRVLFYNSSPESMRATILQSVVPLNGIKHRGDTEIFSKVIEYNGKCVFCNFNHTEDNNLLCYHCVKSFNNCKKFISPEEETNNNNA
jgi:hypothetical protein